MKRLRVALLVMPLTDFLGLIRFVSNLDGRGKVREKLPDVFRGLGTLPGKYTIQLVKDSNPYPVTVPRRIPLSIWEGVEKVLKCVEEVGIIRPA